MLVESLSWIFDKVFFFVPRLQTINQFEGAVFLRFGKHKTKFRFRRGKQRNMNSLEPGIYLTLPFIDEIYIINKVDQVTDLRSQSAHTSDGVDVIISGAIHYDISTPWKALLKVDGVDRCLSRIALGVLNSYMGKKTFEECRDLDPMLQDLHNGIKEAAGDWGLRIKKIQITDFGRTYNIRFLPNQEDPILLAEE